MNAIRINKVVIVAALLGATIRCSAVEGTWARRSDLPTARLGLSTCVVNGKIYVIGGGYSIEGPHSRIVEEYDPATDTWARKADMPTGRLGHAASAFNGKIYVVGGDLHGEVSGATVEEYDPVTDTWTKKADMPTRRTFLCSCTVDGTIYVIGGITAPEMHTPARVEVYDPATDTWTRKTDMPTARSMAAACVVDGKIYVIGGVIGNVGGAGVSTVEEYDPATNTWARKADMPTIRKALSASVVAGRIYATGGGAGYGEPFSALEEYDPETDTWIRKPDMPMTRYFHSTAAVDGKMYVFGGAVQFPPHASTAAVEAYELTGPPPDFNGDGKVDGKDVLILAASWGQDDPSCDIGPTVFGDGIVDVQDLTVLAEWIGQDISDATLIAHWAFDEAEGVVAYDDAGDHSGTVIGLPVWQPVGGTIGGALELDGTTFVVTDFLLNPEQGPFSAFAWVQGGALGQAIISQQAGFDWLLLDPATGTLMTELRSGGRVSMALYSEATVADGQWHRVGFTWDGSNRRLYVDDILVAEDTDVALAECYSGLNIGCGSIMAPNTFFTGLIDDVRIYNRAVKP